MKMHKLACGMVLAGTLGFITAAAPAAGTITVESGTPSNSVGVGTYVQALDFVNDDAPSTAYVGVPFVAAGSTGTGYTSAGLNTAHNSGSSDLYTDFFYFGSNLAGAVESVTFTNLTAGQPYDLRFYAAPFGGATGGRAQNVSFTDGTTTDTLPGYQEDGNGVHYVRYQFTPASSSLTASFTSVTDATYHAYGLTLQAVPEPGALSLIGLGSLALLRRSRRA